MNSLPVPDEHSEQVSLFRWWKLRYRDHPALLFAIPNGGARDRITGKRLKDEGVRAGIPDICLPWPSGGYHGLFYRTQEATRRESLQGAGKGHSRPQKRGLLRGSLRRLDRGP